MIIPIILCLFFRNIGKLHIQRSSLSRHIKFFFQCFHDRGFIFRQHLPELYWAGICGFSCIRNIKYMAKTGTLPAVIYQSDALRTTNDISSHGIIPDFIFCTGSSIWLLLINEKLVWIRILIQSGGSRQKCSPLLSVATNLIGRFFRHLCIYLRFCYHAFPPLSLNFLLPAPVPKPLLCISLHLLFGKCRRFSLFFL